MKMAPANRRTLGITMAFLAIFASMLACGSSDNNLNSSNNDSYDDTEAGNEASAECIDGLIIGETTRDEIIEQYGDPLNAGDEDAYETMLYYSDFPGQYSSVIVEDEVVIMANFILEDGNDLGLSYVLSMFGDPQETTFSNYLQGSLTYLYPNQGKALVASPETDVVFIYQCFEPMSLKRYMDTWGRNLPTDNLYQK
ncbi:MAG: hypothetical protein CVU43_07290 [Chloroflexi bacterium HGW-Chloroflexi-5]|jgi:hypothetical protein|nr:MAG: hypothetical protein CVU43_07290 [Chloroflexi bacterium HGW-Chloroflexi-5]